MTMPIPFSQGTEEEIREALAAAQKGMMTDHQLTLALWFYYQVEDSLALLGDRFYLAQAEIVREITTLEMYAKGREWKAHGTRYIPAGWKPE
jgi:hypothetical protein